MIRTIIGAIVGFALCVVAALVMAAGLTYYAYAKGVVEINMGIQSILATFLVFWAALLAGRIARARAVGVFSYPSTGAGICAPATSTLPFSSSRENVWGPNVTPTFTTGSRRIPPKLSESLVNNPLWVNNPVTTGPQSDVSNLDGYGGERLDFRQLRSLRGVREEAILVAQRACQVQQLKGDGVFGTHSVT